MLCKCFSILTLCVAESMTENIQHSINEIRVKALRYRDELKAVKEHNVQLEQEILSLREGVSACQTELNRAQVENIELKAEMEANKSQVVDSSLHHTRSEEEIDELVKEIEYCIGQLKK